MRASSRGKALWASAVILLWGSTSPAAVSAQGSPARSSQERDVGTAGSGEAALPVETDIKTVDRSEAGPPPPPPIYSFDIRYETKSTVANSGEQDVRTGNETVVVSLPGGERSNCPAIRAVRSFAQGEAGGATELQANDNVIVNLRASSRAMGGARLEASDCAKAGELAPTNASANTEVTGRIGIIFSDDAIAGKRFYVDLQASGDTSQLAPFRIVDQFGNDVVADKPGERPMIESGPGKLYTAIFSLSTQAASTAPSEPVAQSARVNGRLLLESAPVDFGPYIAGGEEAGQDQYLEVGAFMINPPEGLQFACTAILISPQTALTAAHCVTDHWDRIKKGETYLLIGNNVGGTRREYVPIDRADYPYDPAPQAEFNYDGATFRDDVALLYLERPVVGVTSFARAVVSSDPISKAFSGRKSIVLVGFGAGYDGSSASTTPAGVKRFVPRQIGRIDDRMLYIEPGYRVEGICRGDSGGPAYLSGAGLIAITSHGPRNYCDGSGFLTRVDTINKWIQPRIYCARWKRERKRDQLVYTCQ